MKPFIFVFVFKNCGDEGSDRTVDALCWGEDCTSTDTYFCWYFARDRSRDRTVAIKISGGCISWYKPLLQRPKKLFGFLFLFLFYIAQENIRAL